ncbi:hypothetical protein HRbin01_00423 [archaeon HR01]|nr:hypothetical protein HRbin01_00423 [archaeon HR01]
MPQLPEGIQAVKLEALRDYTQVFDLGAFTYPRPSLDASLRRLETLLQMGVTEIFVEPLDGYLRPVVLGKGFRGVVILCTAGGKPVAAKLKRADAPPKDFVREGELGCIAAGLEVGPEILGFNEEVIVMGYVDGVHLEKACRFLETSTVAEILDKCYILDRNGLDHGQLSDASHHVIVTSEGPVLIDFGNASMRRRPRNVSSITSYLINRIGRTHEMLRPYLRRYISEPNPSTYTVLKQKILELLVKGS